MKVLRGTSRCEAGFARCGYIDGLDEGDPELVYCMKKEG